jgi:putative aldouronate transport system substrate-binding protein
MTAKLNRRGFIRTAAITAGAAALAACQPAAAPTEAPQPTSAPEEKAAEPTTAPETTTECQMDWNPTFPETPKAYDPPIEIAVIWEPGAEYPEGSDRFNNPMYNRTLEHTGIEYTMHWEGYGETAASKFAADMAAGTLADQFNAGGLTLEQLIDEDLVADIKEIWEATASPLVKEKKQYPDFKWWKPAMRGDKLYGIPFTWGPAYNVDNMCIIRQDWLDELGLEAPTTIEGWGDTARAFRDAGLSDFGIGACKNLVTWHMSLDPVFGAYGVMPGRWVPDGSGGVQYDTISPAVKDALAVIRGWYEEGLLNTDFYTFGEGDAYGDVSGSRVGIFASPWWNGGAQGKLEQENPGWRFKPIPYPKGPGGLQGRAGSGEVQNLVCFRKGLDPTAIEAAINNLNWHMEMHVNWLQYQQYGEHRNSHAFAEGFEWVWDENCELTDGPIPYNIAGTYSYMNAIDFGFPYGIYPAYQYDAYGDMGEWFQKDPSELNKAQRYVVNKPGMDKEVEYYSFVYESLDVAIVNEYFGIATDRMKELLPDLQTLESEVMLNIVLGNEDLDRFDEFVEEWKNQGGLEVTEDVNTWYDETYG